MNTRTAVIRISVIRVIHNGSTGRNLRLHVGPDHGRGARSLKLDDGLGRVYSLPAKPELRSCKMSRKLMDPLLTLMPGMQCLTRQLEPGIIPTECEYVNSNHLYIRHDVNLLSDMKDCSAQHRGVGEMRQAEEAKCAAW